MGGARPRGCGRVARSPPTAVPTLSCRSGRCQVEAKLVKTRAGSNEPGLRRHLEGWPILAVLSSIALGAAALAIPRAAAPGELPLPRVDRAEQLSLDRGERERLVRAEAKPLPYIVRAAGDALRRFGEAEASSADEATLTERRADFSAAVEAARKRYGDRPLLDLRAAQTALFVRAVARLAAGARDRDALELGGAFVTRASENGWTDARGRPDLRPDEAGCMFRVRWTHLGGLLETRPFSPTLNEWRLYYRTLLAHSPRRAPGLDGYVDALVKYDPEYPELLARGIVAYWNGRFAEATEFFAQHLSRRPTGPWRLRAQNYLLAAYARAPKS
jgi:hypothetical protein